MLSKIKDKTTEKAAPIARVIAKTKLKPNHLTIIGAFFGLLAFLSIINNSLILGVIFLLVSSFFDFIDGVLARTQKMVTAFGGFLDSVVDRYVDILIFIALGIYGVDWLIIAAAMSGALLVSYTRARAEKIVEKCDVGIAERGERIIFIAAGMLSGFLVEFLIVVAILSHLTAIQRIFYTYQIVAKA